MAIQRRDLLGGAGGLLAALGGCASLERITGSSKTTTEEWIPQLAGVALLNFHEEAHDVAVTVTVDSEEVYRDWVHVPAADQSEPSGFPVTRGVPLSTPFEPAPYTVKAEMNGEEAETDGTAFDFTPAKWETYPTNPCAVVAIHIRDEWSIEVDDSPDDDSACATGETNATARSAGQ